MLRGAIVGFGRMGITHVSILNSHPDVQFVGIADPSAAIRRHVERYLRIPAFEDHEELIKSSRPDFVIVATPSSSHADVVRSALDKGVHVFVEKPFTLDSEGGIMLARLAQNKNLVNQVGYVNRFNDVFRLVKRLISNGALGEPISYSIQMNAATVLRGDDSTWRSITASGGGCLYDFASHGVDLSSYFFGPPLRIQGTVLQRIYSKSVEDAVTSTFLYDSDMRGLLMVNWCDASCRKPAYRIEILGRNGKLTADTYSCKAYFLKAPDVDGFTAGWNSRYVTDLADPVRFYVRGHEFSCQLDHFVDRMTGRSTDEICAFEDGWQTDRVLERMRRDATII
jgi:predicted dehydrogenase